MNSLEFSRYEEAARKPVQAGDEVFVTELNMRRPVLEVVQTENGGIFVVVLGPQDTGRYYYRPSQVLRMPKQEAR